MVKQPGRPQARKQQEQTVDDDEQRMDRRVRGARGMADWGPRLFFTTLIVLLLFFWWLLIHSGGVSPGHG